MGEIAIIAGGDNVWLRILCAQLGHFQPRLIVETGTERAAKLAAWLAPDYGPPLPPHETVPNVLHAIPACDYAINGGVGAILKARHLATPRHGFVNAHPGLLPQYRGIDPVCWALRNGDPQGATVHMMDEGIDTGPILLRREMKPVQANSVVALRLAVLEHAASLVAEWLANPGAFPPCPQDPAEGAYYGAYENPERLAALLG